MENKLNELLLKKKNGLLAQQSKLVLGIKVFNKLMQYLCGYYVEKLTRIQLNMPISALSYPVQNLSLNIHKLKFST